ncbi:MAG: haloacid dehalogenase [Candidatus Angelobacter sp.]|nr:haloacid dehalogenase [Candidatus Angelobacter sp.]
MRLETLAGVIFDFDGVIVDSHPVHLQTWRDFLFSQGKVVSDAELSFVQEGSKREEILRHFLGDITPEQVRDYGQEKDKLFQARAHEIKLVVGFVDFLAQLDAIGLPSAIATSGSRSRVERALDIFDLRSRFSSVVTGEDVARGKPDPALFLQAAQALEVSPSRVLVCEDAVAGVTAAKTAGMMCLAVAASGRGYLLKEAGADLVVNDFAQLNLADVRGLFNQA